MDSADLDKFRNTLANQRQLLGSTLTALSAMVALLTQQVERLGQCVELLCTQGTFPWIPGLRAWGCHLPQPFAGNQIWPINHTMEVSPDFAGNSFTSRY